MFVKLVLAIFALIVMLGTRSYAEDSPPNSSAYEAEEEVLPDTDEEVTSDSDESFQEDEEVANEDDQSEDSLDEMHSDEAEVE